MLLKLLFFTKKWIQKTNFIKKNLTKSSPSGNRTPVARMTGENTHHYTNEDEMWPVRGSNPRHSRY